MKLTEKEKRKLAAIVMFLVFFVCFVLTSILCEVLR